MLDAHFYVKNASIVYIHLLYERVSENNTPKNIAIWTISVFVESVHISKTAFRLRPVGHKLRAPSAVALCLACLNYTLPQVPAAV
jgi:hypothetical protein